MNIETLKESKNGANYFYDFNFSKFNKILYPLVIAAFLFIIKQFIINNFHISRPEGAGLLGLFDPTNIAKELPLWAEILNRFIDLFIMLILFCWEAFYEKKYDKIKFVLLLCLPAIGLNIIYFFPNFFRSENSDSVFSIYFLISFFPTYALYGGLRRKILYGEKLSLIGYLIGLLTVISIATIYQKVGSVLLYNNFLTSIYSYGSAIIKIFVPLSFFYFIFLTDAGFSFKNFIKMPSKILLPTKLFTFHFAVLFTSLLAVHLNFTDNFTQHWFGDMNSKYSFILYSIFLFFQIILQLSFVYLLFSQLLLLQLAALRRRPLWIYLFSFVPVINVIPLFLFFRKSIPLTNTEYFEMEDKEQHNRSLLQFFILFAATVYGIYKYIGLGLSRENLIYLLLTTVLAYIIVLYFRIGVWIAIGVLSIVMIYFLFKDMPTILYYSCVLVYGGIGLYNLHIALFWTAKEWEEIDENIQAENIEKI